MAQRILAKAVLHEFTSDAITRAAHTCAVRATTLDHKTADHAMKDQPVIESTAGQPTEIARRIRCVLIQQFDLNLLPIFHFDDDHGRSPFIDDVSTAKPVRNAGLPVQLFKRNKRNKAIPFHTIWATILL